MHDDNHPFAAILKVAAAWAAYCWGAMTLQNLALLATIVYTMAQLYVLVRDKILSNARESRSKQ